MKLAEHSTVQRLRERHTDETGPHVLDAQWLRRLALESGADDVGFVQITRPELDDQRDDILRSYPRTKALISYIVRMNPEAIRTPARSVANLEFHHSGDEVDDIGRRIIRALEERGVRAIHPAMGFPMEMDNFPGKTWVVSHKPVAVAAGLGKMGIHRNVIHPKFGNFILLGTVLVDAEISEYSRPIDYNPCLECKLCVAACPVGAISPEGHFNFSACYTHNYREFMGGFTDWVEHIADSRNRFDYRKRVTDSESASMWQSLSFGASYKSAYCMAVCPAGDDVIAPFIANRQAYLRENVKPLADKEEAVYVVRNSDAEEHVAKRFPNKRPRIVRSSLRPRTVDGFLRGLPLTFQPDQSKGLDATYHFTFTGEEQRAATIVIRNKQISVSGGHIGVPNLRVTADAATWLGFLAQEKNLAWAMLTRRIRIKGSPRLLIAFGKCFPS
ncbi:MAG: SCP2 sterol-binding domain-containing protein [Candidatus Hydrogenedentes bacterium]|nr:SCP2 sterol-binding domain-containing protein [Candidatus Hydrogenedentota bacterium]